MKRKRSELPTRLYKYALMDPLASGELVAEQLALARRYRNVLLEIELQARVAYRTARSEIGELHELEQCVARHATELEGLRAALVRVRAEDASLADLRARAAELRARLRTLRTELRSMKKHHEPRLQESVHRIRAETVAAIKRARKSSGLYWGTYVLIEQAVQPIRDAPRDPCFRRWDGRGRVGVQLSGGLPVSSLFGRDTRIRIEPIAEDASAPRRYRRSNRLTTLHLRVGSSETGKPIWASWPLILERPLPADGRVKSAWVTRRIVGTHVKWELCVAVEAGSFTPRAEPHLASRPQLASVHFGWRKTERGLRAAYVCGTDGASQEIFVPQRFVERVAKCESLVAERADALDAARDALLAYLAHHIVPDWLAAYAEQLPACRTSGRLAMLVLEWRERRFSGDDAAYGALEAWRSRDRRLLEWLANNREKAYAHRREHYRLVALDLARRYSTLLIDDTDFRALQRHDLFRAARLPRAVCRNRGLAACGELRATLQYMAGKRGCRTVLVPARALGKTCYACGHACGTARADRIEHTCVHCGARWDVDENVARNLLARGDPNRCVETIGAVISPRAAVSRS